MVRPVRRVRGEERVEGLVAAEGETPQALRAVGEAMYTHQRKLSMRAFKPSRAPMSVARPLTTPVRSKVRSWPPRAVALCHCRARGEDARRHGYLGESPQERCQICPQLR